jgi:hypothetical protein
MTDSPPPTNPSSYPGGGFFDLVGVFALDPTGAYLWALIVGCGMSVAVGSIGLAILYTARKDWRKDYMYQARRPRAHALLACHADGLRWWPRSLSIHVSGRVVRAVVVSDLARCPVRILACILVSRLALIISTYVINRNYVTGNACFAQAIIIQFTDAYAIALLAAMLVRCRAAPRRQCHTSPFLQQLSRRGDHHGTVPGEGLRPRLHGPAAAHVSGTIAGNAARSRRHQARVRKLRRSARHGRR